LLTDLQVAVRIDSAEETATIKLTDRVAIALATPNQIMRFGGLSLGESWAMVNGIRVYREEDGTIRWLVKNNRGLISLPVWINRETGQGTFQRFGWGSSSDDCWVRIQAPEAVEPTRVKRKKE
jgi:CRISPR-associated protein Cas5t